MRKIFSKTSLHVLSGMGMKFVNALMLATILFSNITGSVQARAESYKNTVSQRKGLFFTGHAYLFHTFSPKLDSNSVTYLSDITWTSMTNGWGPAEKDKSNGETGSSDGNIITLNGVTYSKGLGVHAYSEVSYDISNQGYELLVSDIGLDDEECGAGSVFFKVYVDGTEQFNSGIMYSNSITQTVAVNIVGANELRLYVSDGGNGNTCDHADWAGARLLSGLPADADESTIGISPAQVVVGDTNSSTVTVTLKNSYGYPVPDQSVELAVASGAGLNINNTFAEVNEYMDIGTTDANGVVTATLKSTEAGDRSLKAQVGELPLASHPTVTFLPHEVSALTSTLNSSENSTPADGQTPVIVTVTALDGYNNPISGANVTLHSTGNAELTQPTNPTDSLGKTIGQLTNTVGEIVTISATVNGVLLDNTVNLTFSNGDLALTMTAPESAVPNSDIQYTVKLRQYEMAAENVMLTVQMPPGVTFIAQNLPFPLDEEGQTLTWSLGTLDPGERLDFTIFANVIPSAYVGDSLQVQAEASTTSLDDNSSNNLVTASTQVVDGRSFSSTVEPDSKTINTDAEAIYSILINNTGLIADTFAITVKDAGNINELNPAWYTLSDSQVTLAPGETRPVELALNFSLQPDKCAFPANIPFFVNVSNSNSIVVTSPAEVNLQLGPVVTDVYPENNPLNPLPSFGSRDVTFSWKTDAQTTGKLYVYPVGQQPGPNDIHTTTASISHSVTVTGLTRNTVTYEWYVEATADCETTTTTPTQHFTIGNGIVFNSHDQFYIINRDYEQVINEQDVTSVKVTNQDSEARNVHLEIKEPYEDLIVNFRGSGSVDGDITLLKGETRTIELVFHAQDAEIKDENYVINAVLTSTNTDGTDTVSDLAVIRVKVLFPGDYTIEEYSIDPVLNITTYRIKNTGMPISDLTITAEDPQTYLPARVMITPQIYHARLEKNGELFFRVIPLYGTDQVANTVDTGSSQGVMASPSRDALNNIFYNLVSEVAGVAKRTTIAKSCGEGKQVYAVTFDGPVSMTMPYDTWYCPNRAHIKIELFTPPIVDGSNLLGGALQMNFSPASAAEVHTVSIGLNGSPLGNMQGVPKGLYSFNLSPSDINTSFMTSAQQTIAVDANFPNFAHYQIGTGGNLIFFLDSPTVYVCAASVEEARQIAEDLYNIRPLPNTMDVEIELPNQGLPAALDQNGFVNIRAVINDNLTTYSDVYSVSAEIEYLDVPGTPADKITLFNDGAGIHGDTTATDRHFNTLWEPRFGGDMKLTVTATAGSQLTDTDTEYFSVDAKPDFEVEKVSTQRISPTGQAAVVTAQIRNNGFTVNGPIAVEFLYYRTENNQKIGDPIHTQRYEIFKPVLGYSAPFIHGESTTVEDNTFIALGVDFLYYVEVVVDPGPSIVPIP